MTQIIWRSLLAFSLAMALSACQAPAKQISEPVIDQFAVSAQVFDTYVEGNQLVAAEQQLQTLGADYSDDERLACLAATPRCGLAEKWPTSLTEC